MRSVFLCSLLVAAGLLAAAVVNAAEEDVPNVVLIISDDHGFPDYGFMGHPHIQTPNLDRLASESLLYTRGYVSTPLCGPSLTSMQTGLYAWQNGYTGNDPAPKYYGEGPTPEWSLENQSDWRWTMQERKAWLDPYKKLPQLPKMLQEKGYLSLHTGKFWQEDPAIAGFTHSLGETNRHGSKKSLAIGREGMEPIYEFIEEATEAEKPFLVWYAPFLPHTPHNPPERLAKKYKHLGHDGIYYAMVEWLDETCGELLDHLDEKGLSEDTVIMFISDNGWPGKDKVYPSELGMRTPIMIKWPGKVEPKLDVSNVASNIDLAPTILGIVGLEPDPMMLGVDLLDHDAVEARRYVFGDNYHHDMARADRPEDSLRARTIISKEWKLTVWEEEQPKLRKLQWLTPPPAERIQLFNLQLDPFEKTNVAADRPDVVETLTETLDAWWTPRD